MKFLQSVFSVLALIIAVASAQDQNEMVNSAAVNWEAQHAENVNARGKRRRDTILTSRTTTAQRQAEGRRVRTKGFTVEDFRFLDGHITGEMSMSMHMEEHRPPKEPKTHLVIKGGSKGAGSKGKGKSSKGSSSKRSSSKGSSSKGSSSKGNDSGPVAEPPSIKGLR